MAATEEKEVQKCAVDSRTQAREKKQMVDGMQQVGHHEDVSQHGDFYDDDVMA